MVARKPIVMAVAAPKATPKGTWPTVPVIPAAVAPGDTIKSTWANSIAACLSDLWTNLQAVASVAPLPVYANNAAAKAGGLAAGSLYRTGADPDLTAVVH
jgi:hypothetical protein